ncbi:beta-xylanase [Parastagonospora nodorum]|uniref:Beta-xylanase n=1 Tax=Phaeosphaeria nodorum (strain SN15 / ATCC MYA-4574 / FGSC 10173) TaxID=321614 RepID=A0A7U2NQ75_PHANO|nr:beta-xylanase [Parastagonospora nodorum]QRD06358.1 beta-xylanase [Parastagonospora nodorum SN15]KAH3931711.1 beta-xylanase [Parastagonospora nodorum]KAH3947631.1 beta-xylanase [Parastagonospora nodorum]KAH3968952.1 beta-xylanase [Parastagonospora nodorum]
MKASLALTLLPLIAATPTPSKREPESAPGLGDLAKNAGLEYFGTAIDNVVLNNTQYTNIAFNRSEFNQVTPSNGQKWMHIEPARNVFNYTLGDQVMVPAKSAGQIRRCHTFVWHSQLPDWVRAGNFSKPELLSILENHIKQEAEYYSGDCYAWDTVNEAFEEDGSYRKDVWLDTIGPEYIEHAFRWARQYTNPGTKLYYNDYGIERVNNKSLAVQKMVKDFIARGVPIDGVGLQAHFTVGRAPTYDEVRNSQALFSSLGLDTALTELDVRIALPANATTEAIQAEVYANATRACVDEKKCVGVTVWDFWDPVSWVPSAFPGNGDACLWRENFERKPAYYSIAEVLKNAAGKTRD